MSLSFPTTPSVGQVYQNWKWSGSSWDPNPQAQFVTSFNGRKGDLVTAPTDAAPGNRVLIQQTLVSTPVAAVDFFNAFTAYDQYEWEILSVSPASAGDIGLRVSFDGSTFDLSAAYSYGGFYGTASNVGGAIGQVAMTYAALSIGGLGSASGVPSDLRIRGSMLATTDRCKLFYSMSQSYGSGAGNWASVNSAMNGGSLAAIKGVRFFCTGGNWVKGLFNMYGLTNGTTRAP